MKKKKQNDDSYTFFRELFLEKSVNRNPTIFWNTRKSLLRLGEFDVIKYLNIVSKRYYDGVNRKKKPLLLSPRCVEVIIHPIRNKLKLSISSETFGDDSEHNK